MAYEAVDSLQQTLLLILQRHDDHVITPTVKQQIVSIHDKAVVLQFNLKRFPEKETIREVANATEEIIEYLFSPQNLSDNGSIDPTVKLSYQLGKLAEKLESTVGYVIDHCKMKDEQIARALVDENPSDSPSIHPTTIATDRDFLVGFDEDIIQLRSRLIGHDGRKVLPIVGMAGIGKSTLAKYIYDDPFITFHFDIQAWVTISQDYSTASILSQLRASVKAKADGVGRELLKEIEAEDVEILQILWGRRYLIVIDDMWCVEAWDHIRWLFPETTSGSNIIITTRLIDVATYAATSRYIHMMHCLDEEQSWRLFQHKLFGDQDCPLELQTVGKKVVKGCGGLPLSIVIVAGILSGIPRTPNLWQQIEGNDGKLGTILSLSYNHLPPHLKECFLYMAGFPKDYEIHASELVKLWVAEGFLECQKFKCVEEVAEECLEDLIKQSLVLVTSRKSDGKPKSCRLHCMVRDFCVRHAGQENILLSVMDYFPTHILRRHFLPQVLQNHHCISVSWHDLQLRDSTHSSCTTSIICIPHRGYRPKGSVENFTSLRVLHVLRRNDHSYWELGQVFELINLTYLASSISDSIVPPAISKLKNLQTLIIYRFGVQLPVDIWRLRQLRHLIAFSFHPLPLPKGATPSLENLQTLSMATNFVCSERMMDMISNIKKLGICYSEEKFGAGYHIDNLIHLLKLEKLKLEMHSSFVPRLKPVFPPSLKKLELSGEWISWRDMTIVGSLPNLQVLKLKNYACSGEHWETIEGEFLVDN
ncbi:putative late blight resistance protein homolog R1A-10 [Salvia hispanica]|uniref:putative late blight resistance protein homolog R1A-10 n=1 Tax=Salvia hispanica TaxID=49212 RepID=UPI0020091AAE|nr:putative late blight resistance protein homolog R1A-10 [Salvia hispanica]